MKRKSTLFLLLTTLLLIAFLVPACQKKYELDDEALLKLQCNASDAESIIDEVGETSETTIEQTETFPSEINETEATYPSETVAVTEETEVTETTKATVETTKATTKPTADPTGHVAPVVTATAQADGVLVKWNKITASDFEGYKVVYSATNANPKYPDDGYYSYITDRNTTSCLVKSSKVAAGDYYFSVTALYSGVKVAGNAVKATMPAGPTIDHVVPVMNATAQADGVLVTWNKIDVEGFEGYKVVFSATNPNPKYPDDGYYSYITDCNTTSCLVKSSDASAGDYYFSVTALYSDGSRIAGNAVKATMPASTPTPTPDPASYVVPVVTASVGTSSVTVSWNKITSPNLVGYKVVASVSDSTPMYSENGYYEWITDLSRTSCTINVGAGYEGGDVGCFAAGTTYYFSVTAIYDNDDWVKVAGNAVSLTMPS